LLFVLFVEEKTVILYICPMCGNWLDVSWTEAFKEAANAFIAAFMLAQAHTTAEESGYLCPGGCGLMTHVQPADKLFVRPAVVEALPPEELR
jgi:hypothetical protein